MRMHQRSAPSRASGSVHQECPGKPSTPGSFAGHPTMAVGIIMADMGAAKCSSNHVPLLFWFSKYLSSPRFAEEETEAQGSRSPNLSLHSCKGSTVILTLQPVLLTKTLPLPIQSRQEGTERAPSPRVTCCSGRLWSLGCPPVSYNLTPGPFSEKGTGELGCIWQMHPQCSAGSGSHPLCCPLTPLPLLPKESQWAGRGALFMAEPSRATGGHNECRPLG